MRTASPLPSLGRHLFVTTAIALLASACSHCGDETNDGCRTKDDCRAGELCASDGQCVPDAECVADADCTAKNPKLQCNLTSFECELRPGFADECDATRPCAFGEFCSTLLGRCLDASASRDCTRRSQCPNAQICDRDANKCIPDTGCYGNEFCESGEVCDLVAHVCRAVATECASCFLSNACSDGVTCSATKECVEPGAEAACRSGEVCDPLGRCVQCTSTADCGPGLFCNVALGRCESNVQCATDPSLCPDTPDVTCVMCMEPEVCDMRTRKCQAPVEACDSDVDCPGDQFCNLTIDPPVCQPRIPDCLNDRYEDVRDNNHFYDATLLTEATGPVYDELEMCPGDADWYRLEITSGTYLSIDARFRQEDGDLDVQLFLTDGVTLLRESRSTNDNERVSLDVGTDLEVLVRVFLARPSINPVPYRLIITRDVGDVCPDDANEADDSPALAKALTSDTPHEARLCPADPDWYVIRQVAAKTEITVTLDFTSSLGDLDLELYRAGASVPLLRASTGADQERIVYSASYGGDYYVRVVGQAADGNVYTIRANLRENLGAACLDDQFEPNDRFATPVDATPFLGAVVSGLTMCTGDEDWYGIDLGPGEGLTAEIGFQPGADLELRLYPADIDDATGSALRSSTGVSVREHLGWRAFQQGNYLLRVHGHDQSQSSPYELRVDRLPPFVTCDPDVADAAGRGNTFEDAWDLAPAPSRTDDLTLCSGDEDWYRVILTGGFVNVIRVQYIENDAQLDFALVNAGGQQLVATAGAGTDTKEIAVTVTGSGVAVAYIRVFRTMGFESSYGVTLDLVPTFNCLPDATEPNNSPQTASALLEALNTPVDLRGLTLCPSAPDPFSGGGDVDWFRITPPAANVRIDASIEFTQGDLFLELVRADTFERACLNFGPDRCYSDGFDLTETITFTSTVARPYYLHVGSIYSSPNVQVRPPDADTGYTLRLDYVTP
ncbi:hypothetical protein L6R52_00350 [Myxococcota bacterium]|nr:hypothetical protein [Myxococcota bacterium]